MIYNACQEEFRQKLTDYLQQHGHSQAWIARQLGYHRSTFNKWLNGDAKMPLEVLNRFCKLYQLDHHQQLELVSLAGHQVLLISEKRSISQKQDNQARPLVRHNLPPRYNRFIGRETEITQLLAWVGNPAEPLASIEGLGAILFK